MGQINVSINGRTYPVACDDGQEGHLMELADYISGHADGLASQLGNIADSRLLLMTSLLVADELSDALKRLGDVEAELEILKTAKRALGNGTSGAEARSEEDEAQLVEILGRATKRVQDIAARVASA